MSVPLRAAFPVTSFLAALAGLALLAGCGQEDETPQADTSFERAQPAPVPTDFPEGEPVPDNDAPATTDVGGGMNAGGGMLPADEVAAE